MDFPSLTTNRTMPRTVITSKPARTAALKMKTAYDGLTAEMQQHQANIAAAKSANPVQSVHPVVAAAQSNVPFENLLKTNPAAAYHRSTGQIGTPQQVAEFQRTMSPESGLNPKDVTILKDLLNG